MITRSLVIAAVLAAPTAHAQLGGDPLLPDPARLNVSIGRTGTLELPGELRLVGAAMDGVSVRAEDPSVPTTTPDDRLLAARLRLRPQLSWIGDGPIYGIELLLEGEITAYPVGGDAPDGLGYDPIWRFRGDTPLPQLDQAYGRIVTQWGSVQAGLTRSSFGLGTLADGGQDPDPYQVRVSPFGYATTFDRVARTLVAIFPWAPRSGPDGGPPIPPLAIAIAGDVIIEDETARWSDGDRAYQLIGGLFGVYRGFAGGVGAILRNQRYEEGGETDVGVGLVTGRYDALTGKSRLYAEAEFSVTGGTTDFARSALREGPFDVLAVGAIARFGGGYGMLDGALEAGLASGDDNPVDDEVHTFTFDRGHRVGLLMFGEYARLNSAITSYNLADPRYRQFPSRGFDQVANGGAVQNALYLNPRLSVSPLPAFALTVGYLYARSEEAYADPYRTALAGGVRTGPRGAQDARELGHELDVGVAWKRQLPGVELVARGQLAVFAPGDVFDDAAGETAPMAAGYWLHVEAKW